MKIAYLSDYNPENVNMWSGTPFHVYNILKKYHEVDVIGVGYINGVRWHHLFLGTHDKFYVENYIEDTCRVISVQVNRGDYDIVLSCTYHFCAALNVNVPVIYYSDITFDAFQPWFKNKDPFYHKLARNTENKCLVNVDRIIYPSEWAKRQAVQSYGVSEEKIDVIEFGANIPEPENVDISESHTDVCNLVFIGKEPIRKGLNVMLSTYKRLKQFGFICKLVVIGCRVEDELDVTSFPFLDKGNTHDMILFDEIMRKSNILVLPTVFDAFGIVFCESSAYGIPCVTANVGGVNQVVKDGVNGVLLPEHASSEEYASAIMTLFNDKLRYYTMRKASLQEYRERLNWDIWCQKFTKISENLIKNFRKEDKEYYLPVYVINLNDRKERRIHIEKQFENKKEFEVTIVDAVKHDIGAVGLWESLKKCINYAIQKDEDVIVVCEDDHYFTNNYSAEYFLSNVIGAANQGAELLSGGISNFRMAIPVSSNRYWIDRFFATQFIVLYKPIFEKILNYKFKENDAEDLVLPLLSDRCMVIYPFISEQYNFGYSDVTPIHNKHKDIVDKMFASTNNRFNMIHSVRKRFCGD